MASAVAVIGVLASFVIFIILAYKGIHFVWAVLISSVVVILTNQMTVSDSLTALWTAMGDSVPMFVPILLFGGVYAKLLQVTGVAKAFSLGVLDLLIPKSLKKTGRRNVMLLILLLLQVLLMYGGLDVYSLIFIMLPIVAVLFEEYDVPRKLIPAMVLCAIGIAGPGPGITLFSNLIPMQLLNTSRTAGLIPGIVGMVVVFAGVYVHFVRATKRAAIAGESFDWGNKLRSSYAEKDSNLPNRWLSIVPFVVVVLMFNLVKWDAAYCVLTGAVVTVILFWKYIPEKEGKNRFKSMLDITSEGLMMGNGVVIFLIASGYAAIVSASSGFEILAGNILKIPGPPIIVCAVILVVMVAICGNPMGGLMIGIPFAQNVYIANGLVSAAAVHRIASYAFVVLDSLPIATGVIMVTDMCGLTQKESYKHIFVTTVLWTFLGTVAVVIMYLINPNWP